MDRFLPNGMRMTFSSVDATGYEALVCFLGNKNPTLIIPGGKIASGILA
jgi:hypothetical protein